jgi:hypothetical protein
MQPELQHVWLVSGALSQQQRGGALSQGPANDSEIEGPMAICKPLSSRYRPGRQRYLKINSRIQAQAGELKSFKPPAACLTEVSSTALPGGIVRPKDDSLRFILSRIHDSDLDCTSLPNGVPRSNTRPVDSAGQAILDLRAVSPLLRFYSSNTVGPQQMEQDPP